MTLANHQELSIIFNDLQDVMNLSPQSRKQNSYGSQCCWPGDDLGAEREQDLENGKPGDYSRLQQFTNCRPQRSLILLPFGAQDTGVGILTLPCRRARHATPECMAAKLVMQTQQSFCYHTLRRPSSPWR